MKKFALLSLGLMAALTIVFRPRDRAGEALPLPAGASHATSSEASSLRSPRPRRLQEISSVELAARSSIDELLGSIREKLTRLNETPKADKGAEDELMT